MLLTDAPVAAVLPAEDIDRAKAFYTEKLGLKLKDENKERGELYFDCGGGTMLLVYKRKRTTAEHTAAAFKVDNIEQTMEELRAKGVTFEEYDFPGLKTVNGIATVGDMKGAWFTDPEGNIVAVSEM